MQINDELMAMTLPREARSAATQLPVIDLAARRRAALRTALILASVAAAFFFGIIVKFWLLGA
ncbi:cytochrome oxidase small assembly protein [Derxia lacustris]|uniref:cytochrome oxidase small assembly protein n=1 Tax=Derxia lacustris TaxID=764842 RepID=UPI000A16EA99|nr:cytochrome oxidase small assembly protein [Derxia lacustris]